LSHTAVSRTFPAGSILQSLNLASNSIEILESGCLDQLTELQELKLSRNRLSSLPKMVFIHLGSLHLLELNKNRLVEIPGLTFDGLNNVRVLKLKRNNLRFLMDGAFYGLKAIEELYLDRNEVSTVNKGWLYGLTKLKQLSLAHNQVDYIEDDGWDFCRELWELNLQGNQLEIVERNILRRLPRLTHLDLRDNKISHIDALDSFQEVPLLRQLWLDGNQLSHTVEDTAAPFKHLKQLQKLSLARNSIKSVGNQALLGLEALENLDLTGNVISTLQENPFSHLPRLQTLLLNSSSLLCDCNLRWLPQYALLTGLEGLTAECAHPEALKGDRVAGIQPELFTCEDFPKPYILVEPETQIALRGRDLTLYCRAASTSPATMTFVWKKDGSVLEYAACDNDNSCIKNEKHSFDGKGMEITSELRLKNLTHIDIGAYQCIVDNIYGATYSTKANITVYVYPQFVLTPKDKTVQGGATATLKCSATGVPQPDISWQKDSGRDFPAASERRLHMDPETNTYEIRDVRAADMGVYSCTASNLAGAITTNITLSVLEVPRFVKPMVDKVVKAGETAVLECQSSGSPRPSLSWQKDKGPMAPTERHFFTADNQLLIIVKVEEGDAGQYQCEMTNQLGTTMQTSFLTVQGVPAAASTATTGIIVIAVVCCVLGTSLVWVLIIYQTRRRAARRWEDEGRRLQNTTTGRPLLGGGQGKEERGEEEGSEKDSGTGDSKRSYDHDLEPSIVDHVIHNFLSARGEASEWAALMGEQKLRTRADQTATSLSDLDTGISSLGDSTLQPALHRRGCPRLRSIPPPPSSSSEVTVLNPGALAVENPLYDQLPAREEDRIASAPPSDCASPPASVISDSVAYCGRFPSTEPGQCRQCGELKHLCGHTVEEAESVSSARSSTAVSADQPLTFNTFQPFRPEPRGPEAGGGSEAGSGREDRRKRLSAIELPTGETYLSIESPVSAMTTSITVEKDLGLVARQYRGGGTLPRPGLQQEWLEASLAPEQPPVLRRGRERSSRRSVFRSSKRLSCDRGGSLPRSVLHLVTSC
jgi:Leucine-rich repeat (LRR) protein